MAKAKSSSKGLTASEINRAERNSFVVIIGQDFYFKEGVFIFTATQAEKYYEVLLENILYTIDNGNAKQHKAATKCLESLSIQQLRIQ